MSASGRCHELIQRYLDGLASEADLVELEVLLTSDSQVADAFAEAMRLHACLNVHFQKQYKIDQIARLLEAVETPSQQVEERAAGRPGDGPRSAAPATDGVSSGSTFVPPRGLPLEPRRPRMDGSVRTLAGLAGRRKWIAAALLLLATGAAVWFSMPGKFADQARVVSGGVVVSGHEVTRIVNGASFDVASRDAAVVELPGGARLELDGLTRASFHHEAQRTVLRLANGGGKFSVPSGQIALVIETPLGTVAAAGSRFSVILMTTSPVHFTVSEPIQMPQLTIAVASGTVTIERGGVTTTLAAGDEQVFF